MNQKRDLKSLPKDWHWVKLGEYVNSIKGKKPKSVCKEKTKSHSIPYVNIKAFEQGIIDEYTDGEGCVFCEDGDFLMVWDGSRSGYVGKGIKGALGSTLIKLDFPSIENNYAYYFLKSKFLDINTRAKGVGIPHVDPNILWNYDLLIPPAPIQHAIVSKIEELFSELDKGIEQLKIAQQQLNAYRQAVLKWAFEGKFTNENIKEGELPEGWAWSLLGEVSKVSGGLTKNSKRQFLELKLPFLRVANVYFNYLNLDDIHTIGISENEIERVRLKKDDLLFVEGNGSIEQIGRVALWNGLIENCVHQNHLIKARFSNQVVPKYALYFFCSIIGRNKIKEQANSTSGLHTLSLGKISNLQIPLSPIEEQNKIVQEIESRLSVADKMEETINQSLQQAEALRQSILKRAFEGKLVAYDTIESIKEPAKVIPLERKVLAGKIIHLLHDDKYFGLTKFQKILYLVENYAEVPYETNFIQERAGPYDKEFTTAFRKEMQKKDWLQEEQKGKITKFTPGDNIGSLIKDYAVYFRKKGKQIVFVIQQLKDKSTHEAELIATLYAVWNNRLIKKKPVKIDLLVEDFFNWSPKKKEEFQHEEIVSTYKWMKKIKFMPSGFGKVISID